MRASNVVVVVATPPLMHNLSVRACCRVVVVEYLYVYMHIQYIEHRTENREHRTQYSYS